MTCTWKIWRQKKVTWSSLQRFMMNYGSIPQKTYHSSKKSHNWWLLRQSSESILALKRGTQELWWIITLDLLLVENLVVITVLNAAMRRFLIWLYRMKSFVRFIDMEEYFGIEYTQICRIFNESVRQIVYHNHHLISDTIDYVSRFQMYNSEMQASRNYRPGWLEHFELCTDQWRQNFDKSCCGFQFLHLAARDTNSLMLIKYKSLVLFVLSLFLLFFPLSSAFVELLLFGSALAHDVLCSRCIKSVFRNIAMTTHQQKSKSSETNIGTLWGNGISQTLGSRYCNLVLHLLQNNIYILQYHDRPNIAMSWSENNIQILQ